MAEDVFRFLVARPPQTMLPTQGEESLETHPGTPSSNLHLALLRARTVTDAAEGMRRVARDFTSSPQFLSDPMAEGSALFDFAGWIARQPERNSAAQILRVAANAFGTGNVATLLARAADSLLASCVDAREAWNLQPKLLDAFRTAHLAARVVKGDRITRARHELRRPVKLPSDVFSIPRSFAEERRRRERSKELRKRRAERRRELESTVARVKVLRAAVDALQREFTADIVQRRHDENHREVDRKEAVSPTPQPRRTFFGARRRNEEPPVGEEISSAPDLVLSPEATQRLGEPVLRVLSDLRIPTDQIEVPQTIGRLEREISSLVPSSHLTPAAGGAVRLGGMVVDGDFFGGDGKYPGDAGLAPGPLPGRCIDAIAELPDEPAVTVPHGVGTFRSVGVADLLTVRQEIRRYELGEVAHIENVLLGESKNRSHRRLRRTEELFVLETERVEETERDQQTTDRFDLQTESQRVISQDTSRQAGVTATGKYGPSVEVTASVQGTSSSSKEDTRRTAVTYARDVTTRAVSRVRERVLERREQRTIEEIEEINRHGIDNAKGLGNVTGVYRWVDKVYRSQIVDHGRRELVEFVVPEPAAFLRYAMSARPLEGRTLRKPDPPGSCDSEGRFVPLEPHHLDESNWAAWAAAYGVTDALAPPPKHKLVSMAFDAKFEEVQIYPSEQKEPLIKKSDTTLQIPDGYEATTAWAQHTGRFQGSWKAVFVVGNRKQEFYTGGATTNTAITLGRETGTLPVAMYTRNVMIWATTLQVICERTEQHLRGWQLETLNSIMTAFNQQQQEYEDALSAAQVSAGVLIQGANPLINRETEKMELKRAVISLLTGQHFDLFDAMRRGIPPYGYPEMSFAEADAEGRYIQFFEQAFEWENIMYLFYGYFWGRKDQWPVLAQASDADPLFAQFLQAGSARVQVPVRPGYEAALTHFVETGGDPWNGGEPPHVDEELYRSIVEEVQSQQGVADTKSGGTVTVAVGSTAVTGTNTAFDERDIDREIALDGKAYRIADVTSLTALVIRESYTGTAGSIPYIIGARLVGEPWEVRLPTTLVYLQSDSKLPDWTT